MNTDLAIADEILLDKIRALIELQIWAEPNEEKKLKVQIKALWTAVEAIRDKIEEENDPYYKIVVEKEQFEDLIGGVQCLQERSKYVETFDRLNNLESELTGLRRL